MRRGKLNMSENPFASFKQGDEYGFAYYFKIYFNALVLFAKSYTSDADSAEDIVEESFIKLWERREIFTNENVIKPYLYRTVSNACIDLLRREKVKGLREKEYNYLDGGATALFALQDMIRTEIIRELYTALHKLPPICRAVILKSFIEGKGPERIANELNISVNTVRSHKCRGLQLLRKKIAISLFLAATMLPV